MKISLDASDFAQLEDYWRRAPGITRTVLMKAMGSVDLHLQKELKRNLPKGAGGNRGLRGSIAREETALQDSVIGMVYPGNPNSAEYAVYVELGTKPHPVSMKGIESLADWAQEKFAIGEDRAHDVAEAIGWKILHHGTPPNPVWKNTFNDVANQKRIREIFHGAMRKIASELANGGDA